MSEPRICDYGDSTYRQDFWEGQGRAYEDIVERRVLARLLPTSGRRLLEVGAGFGRISGEYAMYDQVLLLDYSLEQLQYARRQLGDGRYIYVAADAYRMPFQAGTFEGATMIRVLHHFEDVAAVLAQIRAVLAADGHFILEYANKQNLKAMLRHLLGRNGWSPYEREPIEFVELNFNFHPAYMRQQVTALGFELRRQLPVSWLRLGHFKRSLPTVWLAGLDALLQRSGWAVAPSVFLDLRAPPSAPRLAAPSSQEPLDLFQCPQSGGRLWRDGATLASAAGLRWPIRDGVYDFRQPLA